VQKIEHNSDRDSYPVICGPHSAAAVLQEEPLSNDAFAADALHPEQLGSDELCSQTLHSESRCSDSRRDSRPPMPSALALRVDGACGRTKPARDSRGMEPRGRDHRAGEHRCDDHRVTEVWRQWLQALAHDPEAALAAAQAYQRLGDADREQWLGALETDAALVGVPSVAVYGPLLAVESEPRRLRRIMNGVADCDARQTQTAKRRAMSGMLSMGARLAVLVEPLYLDFVQVLACGYVPGQRFLWVRHDPIAANSRVVGPGYELDGVRLDAAPVKVVIDDLARTIIGHQRSGGTLPEALCSFADLFGLDRVAVGLDAFDWGCES